MTFKIAMLLLALVLLAGAFGKAARRPLGGSGTKPVEAARKCALCGVYMFGEGASCGKPECPRG